MLWFVFESVATFNSLPDCNSLFFNWSALNLALCLSCAVIDEVLGITGEQFYRFGFFLTLCIKWLRAMGF